MTTAGGIACPRGLSPGCPGLVEILESREEWHSAEWGTWKDDRLRDVVSGLIETEWRGVMLLTRGVYREGQRVVLPCCIQIDILHFGPCVLEYTPGMGAFAGRPGVLLGGRIEERSERQRKESGERCRTVQKEKEKESSEKRMRV